MEELENCRLTAALISQVSEGLSETGKPNNLYVYDRFFPNYVSMIGSQRQTVIYPNLCMLRRERWSERNFSTIFGVNLFQVWLLVDCPVSFIIGCSQAHFLQLLSEGRGDVKSQILLLLSKIIAGRCCLIESDRLIRNLLSPGLIRESQGAKRLDHKVLRETVTEMGSCDKGGRTTIFLTSSPTIIQHGDRLPPRVRHPYLIGQAVAIDGATTEAPSLGWLLSWPCFSKEV
eukprot:767903-Hanusia_phi.AAC.6